MGSSLCSQLDAFLDSELPPRDQQQFQHHLRDCPDCRRAVELDGHIARLLVQAHESMPIPAGLLDRVDRRRTAVRRGTLVAAALAAAASLLVAAMVGTWRSHRPGNPARDNGGLVQLSPDVGRPEPAGTAQANRRPISTPPREESHVARHVEVTSQPDVTVIPIPTSRPDVTIVWLAPTRSVRAN